MALGRSSDLSVEISGDSTGLERALKSAETATSRAQNSVTRYDASLKSLESDLMKLEKSLDDDMAASLQRQHDAMNKAGRGMLVFGAAVAAGLGLAGREAVKWESAWTGVTKTVDGTDAELAVLEAQLRGLAQTLPSTHEEIAAVAEAAGQLGVARPAVAGFTKVMIDLAETTNLTADDAATSIAQFMNVMQTAPDQVDELGSALVALGNAGASTEADILAMAQRLSGAGALIGASESDVLALASAMADLGIESQLGGGAASRALTKMYAAVKDGGAALDGFAEIAGVSAQEFATAFETDPIRAVDTFVQGLGRIQASGGNVIAALKEVGISGTQDLSVLLRLAGAGDRLTRSLDLSSEAWAENLALTEEAEKRYGTAEAKVQIATNALRDNAIDIGGVVLPAIAALAEHVTNLATFFGDLPGPVKATITVVAALAAAVALAGGATLVAIPKIHAFRTAVAGLEAGALRTAGTKLAGLGSFLMGPWGIALGAGVAALTIFASKQGETARQVDALKATLDEQTGALTDNSRQWAARELLDSGALDAARELGLELNVVTDAALGNSKAMEKVRDAVWEAREAGKGGIATDLINEVIDLNGVVEQGTADWQLMGAAVDGTKGSTDSAKGGVEGLGGAMGDAAGETGGLTEEVKTLGEELSELSGDFLDNREAGRAVRDSMRDLRGKIKDVVDEHGKVRDSQGKVNKAFQAGTKTGDELQGMLDDLAQDYQKQIETTQRVTGSQEKVQATYDRSRAKLVAVARDLGYTRKQAERYADQVLATPEEVKTHFEANTSDAIRKARELEEALERAARNRQARIDITTVYSQQGRQTVGGLQARTNADGGYQVGPGGPRDDRILSWLSNGEFVVNADSTKRYRALLEAINAKKFANGGFVGGKASNITAGFLTGQLAMIDPTPNLRAYNRAIRAQAAALRALRREQRELRQAQREARRTEKAAEKSDTPAARARAAQAAKAAERAENQLSRAKDRHAKATDRVKNAVDAYSQAQAASVAAAEQVATRAREGASVFGSGFTDPAWVSRKIQDTITRIGQFTRLRRQLVKKGIHPFLLAQLDDEGPTRGAIAFAEQLLAQPDLFGQLNAQSATLVTGSTRLGAETTAIHGPNAGREIRYGRGAGQTLVVPAGARGITINVYDSSGSPERTARETARQIATAGAL